MMVGGLIGSDGRVLLGGLVGCDGRGVNRV